MQILFLGDKNRSRVFTSNTLEMKTFKIFWTLFATATICLSCQKESNPLIIREQQLSILVNQSDDESDSLQTKAQYKNQKLEIINFGLSSNYFVNESILNIENFNLDSSFLSSSFSNVNWNFYGASTKNELINYFSEFKEKQILNISNAKISLNFCNDSIEHYIKRLDLSLVNKDIRKTEYDALMTKIPDTFLKLFRSIMEEKKVRISSSSNYRKLLTEIQSTLTQTQWEDFFQRMHRK